MTSRQASTRRKLLKGMGGVGMLGLAGCIGDDDSEEDEPGEEDTPTPTPEGEMLDSATIALDDDPTRETWNFYGGVMPYWTNILEPLVWVNQDMELEPWLASDWEQVDEVTWEFSLREGVQFHNGEEVTADDVVFSFEGILENWAWAPGWLHVESGGIVALDDHTVEFTTVEPFPTFPGTIAHNMVSIQHPDREESSTGPVIGTGPFQVDEIEPGQYVDVSKFEDYWNEEPQLNELTYEIITDPTTRILNLENREVDVALAPPRSRVPSLEDSEELHLARQERPGAGYAGINIHKEPTDDVTLRKALNHAIDQELLVETIFEGVGEPARGPISPSIYWSAHDTVPVYEQDFETGSDLVEQSDYNGETLTILVANDLVDGREMAQTLQGSFSDIGVDSEIRELERAAYSEAERDGEDHIILKESGSNSGDADYIIYEGFHSDGDVNQRLSRDEGTGLHNLGGEVDELIEQGFQTGDPEVKEEAYGEAQEMIMEEAVVIPIYYSEYLAAFHSNVNGVDLGAIPQFSRWTSLQHWE